jgi:hypothetical protein
VVERYNHARYLLSENAAELEDARNSMEQARVEAATALGQLEERAVDAYTGMGSQFGSILDADNFAEFTDRLEFMGAIRPTPTSPPRPTLRVSRPNGQPSSTHAL